MCVWSSGTYYVLIVISKFLVVQESNCSSLFLQILTPRPSLSHQRPQEEKEKKLDGIGKWYKKGVQGKAVTKFRKGACENCGSMTHKKKDCLEVSMQIISGVKL